MLKLLGRETSEGLSYAADPFPPHALILASSEPGNGERIAQAFGSVRAQRRGGVSRNRKFAWASRSQPKQNKSSAALWHLCLRRLQAGDAAVVLTASALPALPRRSRLACYLKLLAWSATATGSLRQRRSSYAANRPPQAKK